MFESIELATDCLWPPNHQHLHLFRLGEELKVSATDVCDPADPVVRIKSVTTNQPPDDLGDGNTEPDVVFSGGAFCVRNERQGVGNDDREYVVTLQAIDCAGNTGEEVVVVRVPHDQGMQDRCTTGDAAPEVDIDDPRCVLEAPEPQPCGGEGGEGSQATSADEGCNCELTGVGRRTSACMTADDVEATIRSECSDLECVLDGGARDDGSCCYEITRGDDCAALP